MKYFWVISYFAHRRLFNQDILEMEKKIMNFYKYMKSSLNRRCYHFRFQKSDVQQFLLIDIEPDISID